MLENKFQLDQNQNSNTPIPLADALVQASCPCLGLGDSSQRAPWGQNVPPLVQASHSVEHFTLLHSCRKSMSVSARSNNTAPGHSACDLS